MGLKPIRPRLAGESEADYARYLHRADRHGAGLSVDAIALRLGVHASTIRLHVDPVYRWDRSRAKRVARALQTPEEREHESHRAAVRSLRRRETK